MNERIRELESQCWESRQYSAPCFDTKKFAELIVQECVNELLKWRNEPFPFDAETGARIIKDHFSTPNL